MKKCKFCNVDVETEKKFCPLCYNKLINDDGKESDNFYPQRKTNEFADRRNSVVLKLFIFITICVLSVCATINGLINPQIGWFWVIFCSFVYLWVLITHTIMSKKSVFKKVFLQFISIFLLLFAVQKISSISWLFNYVFPSIGMSCALVLCMLMFTLKNRSELVIGFLFIFLVIITVSILCLFTQNDTFKVLNVSNILLTSLAFFGTILFGFNALKSELLKKWHI